MAQGNKVVKLKEDPKTFEELLKAGKITEDEYEDLDDTIRDNAEREAKVKEILGK